MLLTRPLGWSWAVCPTTNPASPQTGRPPFKACQQTASACTLIRLRHCSQSPPCSVPGQVRCSLSAVWQVWPQPLAQHSSEHVLTWTLHKSDQWCDVVTAAHQHLHTAMHAESGASQYISQITKYVHCSTCTCICQCRHHPLTLSAACGQHACCEYACHEHACHQHVPV